MPVQVKADDTEGRISCFLMPRFSFSVCWVGGALWRRYRRGGNRRDGKHHEQSKTDSGEWLFRYAISVGR